MFACLAGRPVRVVAPFLAGRLARLGGNPNASPHRLCRAALYLCRWRPRQLAGPAHYLGQLSWPDARIGKSGYRFGGVAGLVPLLPLGRSEEHTSELQSLMRLSYAVF